MSQYIEEMKAYNETLNDSSECKSINDNKCFKSSQLNGSLNERFLPRKEYFEMLFKLESWGCYKPKSLFFKFGLEHCYRIFKFVEGAQNVRNKGAYFRTLLVKTN